MVALATSHHLPCVAPGARRGASCSSRKKGLLLLLLYYYCCSRAKKICHHTSCRASNGGMEVATGAHRPGVGVTPLLSSLVEMFYLSRVGTIYIRPTREACLKKVYECEAHEPPIILKTYQVLQFVCFKLSFMLMCSRGGNPLTHAHHCLLGRKHEGPHNQI